MSQRLAKRMGSISPSLTLAISAKAKAMKADGEHVVNFGVGEPDFNTPEHIVEAAVEALERGHTKYTPSSGLAELRRAICEKLQRDNDLEYSPSQIIVSNGAKHSIFNVCFAVLNEGDEVIIPAPYWLTYPEVVKVCGGVPVIVKTSKKTGFKITPERLREAITPKTKLFIFNSPCNPTGAVYSEKEVRALAAVCEEAGILVLSDEVYEKLVYGEVKPFSMAACSKKMKDLTITVNGVSKTYAMTGWRIGYLAAPLDIAKAIDSLQSHATSNPNSIAQYATVKALNSSEAAVEEMVARFARRRLAMIERVSEMQGAYLIIPDGAFYAMLVVSGAYGKSFGKTKITDSVSFASCLLDAAKVAVVPGAAFGQDDCVRLSYSLSMQDMLEGLDRIDAFIQSLR
ncbi:MAG: pyridoxal phosphate-dependent aminotransferase [Clostridia bacterium]|nr:pyridoxal phosphate-dependent aminotransferase [Clostridia bacterium]